MIGLNETSIKTGKQKQNTTTNSNNKNPYLKAQGYLWKVIEKIVRVTGSKCVHGKDFCQT